MTHGVFDIGDAQKFFESLQRRYRRYESSGKVKSTEDLLYIIMGLNHLREWIAPNFKMKSDGTWPTCDTSEKTFSKRLYDDPNHQLIRAVCNATKHFKSVATSSEHTALLDDWPDLDSVGSIDTGPPTKHLIDGKSAKDVIDPVIQLYAAWFS